jgi:PqqD family protein of HPr-rel-A system
VPYLYESDGPARLIVARDTPSQHTNIDPTTAAQARHWRIVAGRIGDVAQFEDATIVLNRGTWETHFLNPEAERVLELLQESPRGEPDLAAALLAGVELTSTERLAYLVRLRETLAELETLGLVAVHDGTHQ